MLPNSVSRCLASSGAALIAVLLCATPVISAEVLIKNITDVEGDRKNHLHGLGLVTGLADGA